MKCASCGFALTGKHNRRKNVKHADYFGYVCSTVNFARASRAQVGITCDQGYITAEKLENAVWKAICDLLLNPSLVIESLEKNLFGEQNQEITNQLEYLREEIQQLQNEDDKLYRLYVNDYMDEHEYGNKHKQLKTEIESKQREIEKLRPRQITREQFEAEKEQVLALSQSLHKAGILNEVPFELKRKILKLVVDSIVVNTREGWFTLSGSIAPLPITTTFACENKTASPA
jgi:hypothetical protein